MVLVDLLSEVFCLLLLCVVWFFLDGIQVREEDLLEQVESHVGFSFAKDVLICKEESQLLNSEGLSLLDEDAV
jgi:hypothetical protein